MGIHDSFDVLIVGAGPAGLLLASLLSPRIKVGVIERNLLGFTSKYWLTSHRRLKSHELEACLCSSFQSASFGTFLGDTVPIAGDFVLAREREVLQVLAKRAALNGATVIEECPALALRWGDKSLAIATPKGELKSSLLVDASGGMSTITSSFKLHKVFGFYTVYGLQLGPVRLKSLDLVGGIVPELGFPPVIFEVIPIQPDSVVCSAFVVTRRAQSQSELEVTLNRFISRNDFFEVSRETITQSKKFGAIPIGKLSRRRMPRIVGFGEAGMMQSPLLGGAFNEVLVHAERVAAQILRLFEGRNYSRRESISLGLSKKINDQLQLILARLLIDGTVISFQRLVEALNRIQPDRAYRLLSSELTAVEVLRVLISGMLPVRAISKAKDGSDGSS